MGLISKKEIVANEIYDNAAELEDFAIEIRYPDTIIQLTDQDIARAIQIAKDFRQYIITKMNLDLKYEEIKQ